MTHEPRSVAARIRQLETQMCALKVIVIASAVVATSLAILPVLRAQQVTDSMRVRQLIVEDADGRDRVVLGYLDAPGNPRRIGMRINDPSGVERFGLSFRQDGAMVMGFDAPPGTGDDRNRERINIVADETGGAYIRFLDRRTSVASRMYLDEQNRVWLSFSDFTTTPAQIRRHGLAGEEVVRPGQ